MDPVHTEDKVNAGACSVAGVHRYSTIKDAKAASGKIIEAFGIGGTDIDGDEHLWRKCSGGTNLYQKDLLPASQQLMIRNAYLLYDSHPIAHAIIDAKVEFILNNGISYTANDKFVKEVIDRFWENFINNLQVNQTNFIRDLFTTGELINPVGVNKYNGECVLGYIDPLNINKVYLDPRNSLVKKYIYTAHLKTGQDIAEGKRYTVIHQLKRGRYPGLLTGDVFYFSVNGFTNSERGRSDLLPIFDILDAYDRFLWTRVERAILQNSIVWTVLFKGKTDEQIEEWVAKNKVPPQSGSVIGHNENCEWKPVVPDFKVSDCTPDAKLFLSMVSAGSRFPRHYLGLPEDTNRAVSVEMSEPTVKHLSFRQQYVKYIFNTYHRFVIDQAIRYGKLQPGVDKTVDITMPEISTKAIEKISKSFEKVSKAMDKMLEVKILKPETCVKILSVFAKQLGITINLEDEVAHFKKNIDKIKQTIMEEGTDAGKN
jgi:hypothetical protein